MSSDLEHTHDIQKRLEMFYQQGEPSNDFLTALEEKLDRAHRQGSMRTSMQKRRVEKSFRFRWAGATILAALFMAAVVLAIGPKQVFAQVQALLGYIPGYGFVDASDARVLLQPVSQTQDQVTITVKQVLSNQEGTYVILGVDGLPPEDEIYAGLRQFIMEHESEWSQMEPEIWRTQASLTLPDGILLEEQHFSGAPWAGYYLFPSLPEDVLEIEFAMDRVPGLVPDIAPHNWHFKLQLGYVTDAGSAPTIEEYDAQASFFNPMLLTPVPVDVPSETDPDYGFNFELVDVVYAQTETALRVLITGIPEHWMEINGVYDGRLVDDLGNVYPIIYGPSQGFQPDGSSVLTFEPLQPGAKTLTLSIIDIPFYVPVEKQSIMVDFGDSPQAGDQFPLDQTINVFDTPIHFSGVRIVQEDAHTAERTLLNVFEFDIEPVLEQESMSLTGVSFPPDLMERLGSSFAGGGGGGSGVDVENPGFRTLSLVIGIPASVPLPKGTFEFVVDGAQILLHGPYVMSWDIEAMEP